jgi:hypothetical protein
MDKIAEWQGMTQTHGFHVDVFLDSAATGFVARIQTYSPGLVPQHVPGMPTQMMAFDDPEELRHEELDELREHTKQRITHRCGKISQWVEN